MLTTVAFATFNALTCAIFVTALCKTLLLIDFFNCSNIGLSSNCCTSVARDVKVCAIFVATSIPARISKNVMTLLHALAVSCKSSGRPSMASFASAIPCLNVFQASPKSPLSNCVRPVISDVDLDGPIAPITWAISIPKYPIFAIASPSSLPYPCAIRSPDSCTALSRALQSIW